jgi:hypothetical protein
MSRVFVHGLGAVSPAGWGLPALRAAAEKGEPYPTQSLSRPGWAENLLVRHTPNPSPRPAFFAHARLRRSDAIAQYTVAAALEALGEDAARVRNGSLRLGIVVCVMAGGVAYSRRFYEEALKDPATASPLIFPETVFNAPASHLAAFLESTSASYTLVGDDSSFLQGLALAADWLLNDQADGCVVVGAEEMDWIVADAMRLFQRNAIHSDGAGALYLRRDDSSNQAVELANITDPFLFTQNQNRTAAAEKMRAQLPASCRKELLCASVQGQPSRDAVENAVWRDWSGSRVAVREIFGEAFPATAAWQCVLACDALQRGKFSAANVSIVGANLQAIGARFTRPTHSHE